MDTPHFAHDSFTVPRPAPPPGIPFPRLLGRIPDDQPLVLRRRARRYVAVFGPPYVGVPLVLCGALYTMLLSSPHTDLADVGWVVFSPGAIVVVGGLVQLGIMVGFSLPGGPVFAAGTEGLWVRTRMWPTRSVFLPWPAVARVHTRRWFWDRMVCVVARDPRAGRRLTASTFYCGRRADDVLAELHRLSGGQVPIG